jgi:hypothetical protein
MGCYPYYGTVVYGTGYYYRPWHRHHYYPRPWTWGFHAWYNPWVNRWSFGYGYWSGFYRTGTRRWANQPRRHGPLWFGPGGYRRPWLAGDLTPVRTPAQHGHSGEYTPVNLYHRADNTRRVAKPMGRPDTQVQNPLRVAPVPNNVFAGKDGKVYQRTNGGQWNVNQGRKWIRTQLPQTVTPATSPPSLPSEPGVEKPGARPMPQSQPVPKTQPMPQSRPSSQPQYRPPSQPMTPPSQPYVPPPTWRARPAAPPSPPTLAPTPGGLEREFQARQRGSGAPPAAPVVRGPQPQKKEPEKEKKKDR